MHFGEIQACSDLGFHMMAMGEFKLAGHYVERAGNVRLDSEALDSQKAAALETLYGTKIWRSFDWGLNCWKSS